MLVLSRKVGETIHIGKDIVITITSIDRNKIRVGIVAPRDVAIYRGELINFDSKNGDTNVKPK